MANIKDFATSLIATAPSPATSGTSLVLAAGMGARMPAVPFNAVAHPDGQLPTLDNAERVLVTARTTDTLTITRAQGLTTAKSIAAGWRLSNSIFAQDILNASSVTDELMTGTVNGTNKVFTTGSNFTNIQVYKNGVAMHLTDDFTITGANQITFVTAPATGTKLTASYILGSQTMINGSSSLLQDETPTGTVNGTNTAFTTSRPYIANTLEVFINGVKQKRGTHFTETTPTSGTFTMGDAPLTGDDIMVNYQFVQSSYGNADTVDGYHANTTPTANQIPVLDSNGKTPATSLYQWAIDQNFGNGTTTRSSKTSGGAAFYTSPSITLTNPYNKTVKMNFIFSVMGISQTAGQNFQVQVHFNGTRVSPSFYWDGVSPWMTMAAGFTYTFTANQSVTARIYITGNGSGTITDSTTDNNDGWNPRLVGAIAEVA